MENQADTLVVLDKVDRRAGVVEGAVPNHSNLEKRRRGGEKPESEAAAGEDERSEDNTGPRGPQAPGAVTP